MPFSHKITVSGQLFRRGANLCSPVSMFHGLYVPQCLCPPVGYMSLVRHIIGPTHHWSDTPLVRLIIGPTHYWSDTPLVRHTIGPTHHWSDSPLVRHTIGPTHHWSDTPLVRHNIGPTIHGRPINLS